MWHSSCCTHLLRLDSGVTNGPMGIVQKIYPLPTCIARVALGPGHVGKLWSKCNSNYEILTKKWAHTRKLLVVMYKFTKISPNSPPLLMRFWAGFDLSNLSRSNPVDFLSFPPPQNDKIVKKSRL